MPYFVCSSQEVGNQHITLSCHGLEEQPTQDFYALLYRTVLSQVFYGSEGMILQYTTAVTGNCSLD